MPRKKIPAINHSVRFPHNLYEIIRDEAEKKRIPFSEVVVSRTRKTFEENWEQTGNNIRRVNRKIRILEAEKLEQKKIRLKEILKRKLKKMDDKAEIKQKEDEDSIVELETIIRDVRMIHDHLEGKVTIWINNYDPNDWLVGDTRPYPDYRKLTKGQLNDELQVFYNENIKYLK